MWIALPNCQGRVSPVFDVASRLLLVHLRGQVELERREIILFEKRSEGIVRDLKELGVQVLICGAISQGLKKVLQDAGIKVLSHTCGDIEPVLNAYRSRTLHNPDFRMPGCCRRLRQSCTSEQNRRGRARPKQSLSTFITH